ncbi:hypothetical protein DI392_00665 [Vibrio albus]|uniref:DUF4258 domain-containing protein n=1 Tax=Vibrio albus TaxID=2200953 RepID=A0A2U3BDH6_9VIBR|nr:DUF4258 domain-containing protein [Vibrio albus]PWI34827.1 hypothetical protein DI392_00665 [Vibrio albus]
MSKSEPLTIAEFPLTAKSAKRILRDLAENHTGRVKFSKHARERLEERDITIQQVLCVLKSTSNRFHEGPYQTERGDWKMNVEGIASGEPIRVPLTLKRHEDDPQIFIITVINI